MGASSEKKRFLKSMPKQIKFGSHAGLINRGFRIPPDMFDRINKRFSKRRVLHQCSDIRDYMTRFAIEGLIEAQSSGINLIDIATTYSSICTKPIYIDYSVINHNKLIEFNGFVDGKYIKNVQDAINYCVVGAYFARVGCVACLPNRLNPPIYS